MILISALTAVLFFGGWQGPFQGWPALGGTFLGQPSFLWLFLKVFCLVFLFLWFRATFPRYRYDQIMRLGWKALIPVTLVWIGVEMLMLVYRVGPWSRPWFH
jgi:NADH-quinone oxidoreductase subunit H